MSLAVIQMVSQSDVLANLAQARRLLEKAAEGGARLAVLPENFAAMGRRDIAALGRAEALGEGPILPWLKQVTRDLTLWVVAGTLPCLTACPVHRWWQRLTRGWMSRWCRIRWWTTLRRSLNPSLKPGIQNLKPGLSPEGRSELTVGAS